MEIRGSCSGNIAIERRGKDAETVRDLGHADVGISQQRLGGLDVVVGRLGVEMPVSAISFYRGGTVEDVTPLAKR